MNVRTSEKPSAKSVLRQAIEAQPENASYEEIMDALAFERMVERGLADVRAGRVMPHDEALRKISAWKN